MKFLIKFVIGYYNNLKKLGIDVKFISNGDNSKISKFR